MRGMFIFLFFLSFFLFSSLGASDEYSRWEKMDFDLETVDCDNGDYCVVEGVNNPEATHTHPVSGNDCTEDVYNVQNAVDNCKYVRLKGEFNFGVTTIPEPRPDGVVTIRNPNVVLKGPATIRYGGRWWQIVVGAPGVRILNLTLLEGNDVGIHIRATDPGCPVIIAGNTIKGSMGIDAWEPVICGVVIMNNNLEVNFDAGIWIRGTYHADEEPNIVPVIIKNNKIHCTYHPWVYIDVIRLGDATEAIDYALVKGNIITGQARCGIALWECADNSLITFNDLSGLGTWGWQLTVYGEKNKFVRNKLGMATDTPPDWFLPLDPYYPGYHIAAYLINEYWGNLDPTWTRKNKLMANDYRNCGLNEGWSVDEATGEILSRGCIVLDPGPPPGDPFAGAGLENNIVAEYLFPCGTNICNQVWDMNGKNKILGWNMLCGDAGSCLMKPVLPKISKGAKKMAEFRNTRYVQMAEKEKFLAQYYAKSAESEAKEMVQKSVIPEKFALKQNYPNPFNPVTTIQFDLPKDVQVKVVVFNALGQTVQTLLDQAMSAGQHQVKFNAQNLTSGIYFYSIQAGEFSEVKKMILLR